MSDFASMKVADLKNELKAKGLPVTGNKQELVERLQQAESASLLDDDLDQDEQISDEAAEEELKKQTTDGASPTKKLKTSDDKENKIADTVSPAKTTVDATDTEEKEDSKNGMSQEEAILKRKERFGGFQSDEAKKTARAQRFGGIVSDTESGKKSTKIGEAPPVDIDILKKRAERFGATVSPHVKEAEVSEAIKKRQERFGVVPKNENAPAVKTNVGTNSVILNEQMQKRKERFNL